MLPSKAQDHNHDVAIWPIDSPKPLETQMQTFSSARLDNGTGPH